MRVLPLGSYISMLGHQVMEFLEIRRIGKCGLALESMSLGMIFEVSKTHVRSSISWRVSQDIALSYCSNVINVSMPRAMLIMD